MTRISSSRVIQMVGDDRVVFVNDHTGSEYVIPIVGIPFTEWGDLAKAGQPFGPDGIEFSSGQWPAVEQTLDYFVECSNVPLEEQLANITIVEAEPGESFEDFARRAGLL